MIFYAVPREHRVSQWSSRPARLWILSAAGLSYDESIICNAVEHGKLLQNETQFVRCATILCPEVLTEKMQSAMVYAPVARRRARVRQCHG
jgi:hypothetical protein